MLEDVSFDVPPGVCVGIVGPTGAGKTTLLGLLPRFYDPGEGAILLDQVDLRDYRLADLRRQFAPGAGPLLDEHLRDIAYGRPGANESQIVAAAAAGAHKFISRPSPAGTTARAHSASATWCSSSRTAGWCPPPRRKEP